MFQAQLFAPGVGSSFNADSPALSSDRTSRDTVKVLNEVKSPLIQMSEFFAGIDSGIIKLVNIAKQSLGLDKKSLQLESRIADIMASDLALEQKENLANQLRGRDANIAGQDTDTEPGEKPEKINFIDSLKEAFADLTDNQTLGEIGKIFLFATGALALAKFAKKFQDEVASVLKYISEIVIPGFKELNKDILDSPTGYLGLGGLISASFYKVVGAFGRLVTNATTGVFKFVDDIILKFRKSLSFDPSKFKSAQMIIKSLTGPTSFLGKIGAFLGKIGSALGKAALFIARFPGIAQILGMTGAVAKFLGPIGLIVQGIVGVVGGLINAVKILNDGGNVVQALGGFAEGFFDAVIGATANLLFDIVGFVVKKLGFKEFGQKLQDMDFSFDSIITGMQNLKNGISDYFYNLIGRLRNKVPKIMGGTRGDVFVPRNTPKIISKVESKQMTAGNSLPPSMKGGEESADGFYERKGSIDVLYKDEMDKMDTNDMSNKIDEFDSQDLVLDSKTANMLAKHKELIAESQKTEQLPPSQKGNNVYMDNKQVTGGTTVNNKKTVVSNQRVESTDRATRELNNVYGYALA